MNGRMIGVIGGTGRVGRECLRYLHENTAFGLLLGGRKPPREAEFSLRAVKAVIC